MDVDALGSLVGNLATSAPFRADCGGTRDKVSL